MGAFDAWATAALGGGITGTATGVALWFTIRHDRHLRKDDRTHDAALRVTEMCTGLAQDATELEPDPGVVLRQYFKFTNAHTTFVAHLGKTDHKFSDILATIIGDLHAQLGPEPVPAEQALNAIAAGTNAYAIALRMWFEDPKAFRRDQTDLSAIRSAVVMPRPDQSATITSDGSPIP